MIIRPSPQVCLHSYDNIEIHALAQIQEPVRTVMLPHVLQANRICKDANTSHQVHAWIVRPARRVKYGQIANSFQKVTVAHSAYPGNTYLVA